MNPVIGITSNFKETEEEYYLKDYYAMYVYKAGGTAIILPPVENKNIIEQYLYICDGLIFSGGGDIDPCYWGELPEKTLGEINPVRDIFELILAQKAFEKKLPVLGICRGCQILNVAKGGSLIQDIQSGMLHQQKAPRSYPFHVIFIEKNTILEEIVKNRVIKVNSFHHQAVKNIGPGMRVSACAPDNTIEGIESTEHPFFLGIQWHPECLKDEFSFYLFKALIKAAGVQKMIIKT